MKRTLLIISLLLVLSTLGYSEIISWDASSGIMPFDSSIPLEERFLLSGESSFVSLQQESLNINDTSNPLFVGFTNHTTLPTANNDWAYQAEIKINSHTRPNWEYGAVTGFSIDGKFLFTVISSDKVGFSGPGEFLNGQTYSMDTTNDFHIYRVVKTSDIVSMYVDVFNTPVLTIAYDEFYSYSDHGTKVALAETSNPGLANFDVKNFIYNTNGITIPEPTTLSILTLGALTLLNRKKS